jgi:PEP-CTERM motif
MKSRFLMMTVAAGVIGLSGAASAEIVTVAYTGPVILIGGTEGIPPASVGDTLVATYVFNLDSATDSVIDPVTGGSAGGPYGSFVTASLTVNGVAAVLPDFTTGSLDGETQVFEIGSVLDAEVLIDATPSTNLIALAQGMNFSWSLAPPLVDISFDAPDVDAVIQFQTTAGGFLEADVANVTVTVSSSPAVPEPSTWAMMLLGFAGLGYAGFRQSRTRVATPERILR